MGDAVTMGDPAMVSDAEILHCPDPGRSSRLTGDVRHELTGALRGWQRKAPPALLVEVAGDAWAHVPGEDAGLRDHAAVDQVYALVTALYALTCPVVVAIDGAVSGLGCALLLAADVRFGSQRAAVSAGGGAVAALLAGAVRLSPASAAAIDRLCWTGDTLTGESAVAAGVLTTLGSFEDARACAARCAADPVGWSAVKRAHRGRTRPELQTALRYESWLLDIALHG
jgi:enoyl-CoA hydratase/carnithine racemase